MRAGMLALQGGPSYREVPGAHRVPKGALVVGAATATAAVGAMVAGLGVCVKEAMAAKEQQAKLNAVIEATGGVAGVTAQMANDLATEFSGLTTFEDDAIVAGESMLLTFKNIGSDVFPQATEAMLNMSAMMGTDLQGSAIQLGKALNDPIAGISALSRVGVTFTDEQKKMIETMMEAGDIAGAQGVILAELEGEFGGVAVAAGQTFSGQLTILKNNLMNVAEGIGTAVLPMISQLLSGVVSFVQSEQFTTWVQTITTWLTTNLPIAIAWVSNVWQTVFLPAITAVWTWMSTVLIPFIQTQVIPFLQTYIPIALQILSDFWTNILLPAITAVWTWISTVLVPFLQGTVIPFLQTYIPVALQILSDFWTNVLLPAITAVWTWISTVLIPFLQGTVIPFLQTYIPIALQVLSDFWTNVLKPAIETVWAWISGTLIPFISGTLIPILQDTLGAALTTLANFWTGTLQPAIEIVWGFIQNSVVPLFTTLGELLSVTLGLAITVLTGLWQNVLLPALTAVWDFISASLSPIIQTLSDVFNNTLAPAITGASGFINTLKGAFDGIGTAISGVIGWIGDLIDKLSNIELPGWLTPGSPTPFEIGLRGITDAMKDLDTVTAGVKIAPSIAPGQRVRPGNNTNNNFNMTIFTNAPVGALTGNFNQMKAQAS